MNSKRSMWKLLVGVTSVGFLVTNCTIKSATDDASAGAGNATSGSCSPVGKKVTGCTCPPNNLVSYQVCTEEGIYGECVCTSNGSGGSSSGGASSVAGSSNGGASYTAGKGGATTEAGAPSSSAGDTGEGGEGGAGTLGIDPTDCYGCLNQLCAMEWDHCVAEDEKSPETPGNYCLSSKADGSGQIEAVLSCIEAARANGLVKRDAVRACGSSLGKSTDPSFFEWPPTDMTAVTAQVLNCMADAPDEMIPGTWADSSNIPTDGSSPKPWLDMTCAKLACTSALK